MASKAADRRAKIEAAAPKRRDGGANRVIIGTVVAVVAIIAVVVGVIVATSASRDKSTAGGSSLPTNAKAMGAPIWSNPKATLVAGAPTMDIYQDYQCPNCAQFEKAFGAQITSLAEAGQLRLDIHLLSFLDDNLRNDSSNRAANAAACADDGGVFLPYNAAVYAGQPAQEGTGYTDAQLTGFAKQAGLTGTALSSWQKCYDGRAHNQYVESVQTQSTKDGINATPTIKIGGQPVELSTLTPQSLEATVKAATR